MFKIKIPHSIDYYHIYILFLLLFLYGYFQRSTHTNFGKSKPPNIVQYSDLYEDRKHPKYDRLVFVVIDALREDFLTNIFMPYTFRTANQSDCLFQVKVHAPTVTLPRIKSLTTGIVPQYFDMISNLWISKSNSSNWNNSFLHSAKIKGKRIVFYGDDTWLHLYADVFQRSEGTSSMFVNDFYEVDYNVTANVKRELLRDDWEFMFLHYLGLDHIGHVEGPKSNLIPSKLSEMDAVIELLHKNVLNRTDSNTLIVVTGDHGMRDSGGHGGTSYAETHVPLALLGRPCTSTDYQTSKDKNDPDNTYYKLSKLHRSNVRQSDIPTTIALLFGLPIPPDSIGKFVPEFYGGLSPEQRYYYCIYNHEMLFGYSSLYSFKHLNWTILSECETSLVDKTNGLSNNDSGEHILLLICCVAVDVVLLLKTITSVKDSNGLHLKLSDIAAVLIYLFVRDILSLNLLLPLLILVIVKLLSSTNFVVLKEYSNSYFVLFFVMVAHSFSLFSSTSYLEEEHQTYYFFFATALFMLIYNARDDKCRSLCTNVFILSLFRFIKCLNQTGDQFASRPDVIDWFLESKNYFYSILFHFLSFIFLAVISKDLYKGKPFLYSAFMAVLGNIFVYKLFYYNVNYYAQALWMVIFIVPIVNYIQSVEKCDNAIAFWICISCLVSKSHNLILIPFTVYLSSYMCNKIDRNSVYQLILHIILGQTMYFCSGFSNSLASVDVASGYIGVSYYDPILVPIIVLCNTYCLPILSQLLLLRNSNFSTRQILVTHVINRMLIVTLVCIAAVVHIQHLFVWTVFAPKVLIESCHSVILWVFVTFYEIVYTSKRSILYVYNKII